MSDVRRLGDRYQVGELIGRGGMAEVHEGRDLRLGRRVAIKILKPDLASDPAFLARFRREAQSAASLNHPNIVAVYDTGEDEYREGAAAAVVPFIVMELVEGITLKELLSSGNPLVPERSLEITSGILAALDYSHRHGIIHRDIKPGNVMLTTTGAVKVMDFGIARAVADSSQTATSTSTVLGTAAYLSPEQAQGRTVDARSDLYSAGVVLFELLTRKPPFVADSPVAVAFAHVNEPPPAPSTLDPSLPPDVDPILARALNKDPALRYQTAVEFRADVERAIAGVPVTQVMGAVPVVAPDSQETMVMGGVDPNATAAMVAAAAEPLVPPPPMPPEDKSTGKRGGFLKGLGIAALVIGLMAAGVWLGMRLLESSTPQMVEVPRLEGLTTDEATDELDDAGLRLGGPDFQASDEPKDSVISQDPPSGELVESGSLVYIVVSAGKEQVQVPDLIDFRSISDARKTLADAGLTLGKVTPEDSEEPEETVLRQDPEPYETVDAGSTVDIWVSNAQVEVPGVVGRSEAQARTDLFNKGFEVGYGPEIETAEFAPGTVAAQTPQGGQMAKKGSLVTLSLAKAPAPTPTPTPSEPADGGADGQGGGGAAGNAGANPGLSAPPAP